MQACSQRNLWKTWGQNNTTVSYRIISITRGQIREVISRKKQEAPRRPTRQKTQGRNKRDEKEVKRNKNERCCVVINTTGEVWLMALYHIISHIAFSTSYYLLPKTMHDVPKQGRYSSSSLILFLKRRRREMDNPLILFGPWCLTICFVSTH